MHSYFWATVKVDEYNGGRGESSRKVPLQVTVPYLAKRLQYIQDLAQSIR